MRLFGFDINIKAVPKTVDPQPEDWQLRENDGQGPYTKYFRSFIPRKVEGMFYEYLREGIPIIDAGIKRLVSLDGHIIATGNNTSLVDEIQEWIDTVQVNDIQRGLQAYHQNFTNEAFEQGFSLGEFIANKDRTDIVALRVADSKFIKFKREESGLSIWQKSDRDTEDRKLNPVNLQYFSIDNENQNPHGTSILRSCEFVSKILVTMQNSLLNVWERFGDPSFSIVYKTSRRDGTDHVTRRRQMEDDFNRAIRAKRQGKSADFIKAIDKDSDITISVIGAGQTVLEFEIPSRHVLEQIIAKLGLPPWMLGMHWSSTERLSDQESEMLMADVKTRQAAKLPLFTQLIKTLLLLRGRTWKKGDWSVEFAQVNLRDALKEAQAKFLNAQADMMLSGSSYQQPSSAPPETSKGPAFFGQKQAETRPKPWPQLDNVEDKYTADLTSKCLAFKGKVFTILKLDGFKSAKDALLPGGLEAFNFSVEQRALIMKAYKDWLGEFDLSDTNSPVNWYYGQAYSLGLIQAAEILGEGTPKLDMIQNKQIFNQLAENGFQLVKDNATAMLREEIIPAMETGVVAGLNPRDVARKLDSIFDDKNSDWERLARTEMTMAAETAKLKEWGAWGVEEVEFLPSPDACPLCMSLAGTYPITKAPIPAKDTHPRCRCSLLPAEEK
jgi:SPP1 gp7 family putative phage head morphogenesis protein